MRGGAQARLFPVDVEVSRRLGGEMRIIGFVTDHAVVVRILSHIEHRGIYARARPWAWRRRVTVRSRPSRRA